MSDSPLSRRGVLRAAGLGGALGLLGAGVVSGCDLDPRSSSDPQVVPSTDPDQHLVEAARAELRSLLARLPAAGGTVALVACHRQQLEALQGQPPTRTGQRLSHARLVARERRAVDRFTGWAQKAENGDLARVLASVAAGISMQPMLRTEPARTRRRAS